PLPIWDVKPPLCGEEIDGVRKVAFAWRIPPSQLERRVVLHVQGIVGKTEIPTGVAANGTGRRGGPASIERPRPAQFVQPSPPCRCLHGRRGSGQEESQERSGPYDRKSPHCGSLLLRALASMRWPAGVRIVAVEQVHFAIQATESRIGAA